MTWIKIKDLIINLSNVKYIERFGKKILIYPLLEIDLKNEEKTKEFFNTLVSLVKENTNNLIDLTKFLEEEENKQ
jgi:hypothetical protein